MNCWTVHLLLFLEQYRERPIKRKGLVRFLSHLGTTVGVGTVTALLTGDTTQTVIGAVIGTALGPVLGKIADHPMFEVKHESYEEFCQNLRQAIADASDSGAAT